MSATDSISNTDKINYLNIGLMLLSLGVAFRFPFELFLFSYAVLGPLHYLTEISWLHERKYFTESQPGKSSRRPHKGWLMLVGVTMVALIVGFVAVEGSGAGVCTKWEITLFYLVFVTALMIAVFKTTKARVIVMV